MYKVQRLYLETQEASDLGTYVTLAEAKDRLVAALPRQLSASVSRFRRASRRTFVQM